jgi:peptidyl-prolyl cis-trans isomerase C
MKKFLVTSLLTLSTAAIAQGPVADVPLITNGDIRTTSRDFEAFMLRIPEAQRAEFRASMERITKAVELVYTNRVLAEEAKKAGLDKDPYIAQRAQQIVEAYYAQVWQDHYQKNLKAPDMTLRAEELYKLNRERFRDPERLDAEHILISLQGRTQEQALARAREARAKWEAGESFAQMAALYTDDPNFKKSKGLFEQVAATEIEKPIADIAFALTKPGEISQPVVAGGAVHLVKLKRKIPAKQRTFAEVKDLIIAGEKDKWLGFETDRRVGELKNTPQTKVYEPNIGSLFRDIDREAIDRKHREQAEAAAKGAAPR